MIDRIQAMRTFMRIVETNSFSRAAESLDIPRTTATTMVQQLEALLGTQLLLRTTRRLSLTSEGAAYYERCARILTDIDELEADMRENVGNPRGRLRVEMPDAVATYIVLPALDAFHRRYPEIDLAIGISNRPVDLVREAIDCSIQLGDLPDSGLVARRLGTLELVTCASPAYLAQYGMPETIADLSAHQAVNCMATIDGHPSAFDFDVVGTPLAFKVEGFVQVNDGHAYLTCGMQGLGMIQPARIAAQPFLDAGLLIEVLPQWKPIPIPVSVAYVKRRQVSTRVRAFVDWLADLFEHTEHVKADMQRVQELMDSAASSNTAIDAESTRAVTSR